MVARVFCYCMYPTVKMKQNRGSVNGLATTTKNEINGAAYCMAVQCHKVLHAEHDQLLP